MKKYKHDKKGKKMEKKWFYNDYQVEEGLKPGSKNLQYFFKVAKGGEKKCNFCIWIEDEALSRFDKSKNIGAIISSQKESWRRWVQEKIDEGDLKSKVLQFGKKGQEEVDLSELIEHLSIE